MAEVNGGELLARCLAAEGVRFVFGSIYGGRRGRVPREDAWPFERGQLLLKAQFAFRF